jgi:hypothetical protein
MSAGVYLRSIFARPLFIPPRPLVSSFSSQIRRFRCFPPRAQENPQASASQENLYGGHSRFIAEAKRNESWSSGVDNSHKGGEEGTGDEVDDLPDGVGESAMHL